MPVVSEYSDTDRIRSVLGFTLRDVSDEFILRRGLEDEVLVELFSWLPTHSADYTTWVSAGFTAAQENQARLLRSYTTYLSAFYLCSGIEMLAQREITDSKMGAQRYSKVDLNHLATKMYTLAASAKTRLAKLLAIYIPETPNILFSKASPSFDPVKGS